MTKRLSEKTLHRLTRLLSAPMIRVDCGRLCAPANDGLPQCCDPRITVPILYADEFAWHSRTGSQWRRYKPKKKADRKWVSELDPYYVPAVCRSPKQCDRSRRALVCRMFPFEPYVDRRGRLRGLVYHDVKTERCPLIGRSQRLFYAEYVRRSLVFWSEVFRKVPTEHELYARESRKRRRRCRRKGRKLRLITPGRCSDRPRTWRVSGGGVLLASTRR